MFTVSPVKTPVDEPMLKSSFQKWDMLKTTSYQEFRYNKHYHKMSAQEFAMDFFNDDNVQQHLKIAHGKSGEMKLLHGKVTNVDVEVVPCNLTRLDLFDKLADAEPTIVRCNGDIAKCMEDQRDGFQVSDMLREMLLCEESDNAELYSETDKAEFLWHVFEHLCLGGGCCQFEDKLEPYVDATKRMYKALLSVQKNPATSKIEVMSAVYRVKSITTETGIQLFPSTSRNNFCYLCVDPMRRVCKVWYHAFVGFW